MAAVDCDGGIALVVCLVGTGAWIAACGIACVALEELGVVPWAAVVVVGSTDG